MLIRVHMRIRSKAGVPFDYGRHLIPVDWIELDVASAEVNALLANGWLECVIDGPLSPMPQAMQAGIDVRVRTRVANEVRIGLETFGTAVRVLRVASREEVERLCADARLVVCEDDPTLYPPTVFVKVRAIGNWSSMSPRLFNAAVTAYELSFEDFSHVRFDSRLHVDLLDPATMPPLTRVRIRSRTGHPFFRFGRSFAPDRWQEVELYPQEIERLLSLDARVLAYEECSDEELTENEPRRRDNSEPAPSPDSNNSKPSTRDEIEHDEVVSSVPKSSEEPVATHPIERIEEWAQRADVRARGRAEEGFTLDEILAEALGADAVASASRAFQMEVANLLKRLGWERPPMRRRNGVRVRLYVPGR